MKSLSINKSLACAITVSVLAHGALLAVRFVPPDTFKFKPADPGLEVILVNAKHDNKPVKAEALAQANLDGGGNADAGRAKSPLPDLQKTENGDSVKAARQRLVELEEQQRKLLEQLKKKTPFSIPHVTDTERPKEIPQKPDGSDAIDSSQILARQEAEIFRRIEDENKRPKKTRITPSTREVGYAMYYDAVKQRIEKIGTLNFPTKDGKKLYGELVVSIPIYYDGRIYEKEGPVVEQSSGNPALDQKAIAIVRRAAPFGFFPKNMRTADKDDIWVVYTRFKFTREEALETELRGNN